MFLSDPPTLYLVDGYALIYRAFFAMIGRPLRTSRGENTSAVWGVANFLQRLFTEYRPTHVAWVHDAGSSFRSEVYPEYKATREKLDEELQQDFDRSLDRVEALLEAYRVPLVAVDGYEADDVIGTLASRAAAAGMKVVIVSGDKDFYQLIAANVALLNPGRGGPAGVEEHLVDMSNASERLGVPPDRVVDYLALVGDSSDNVPGVRGVGDKTARKLIEEYGDLETILSHAAEMPGKRVREALVERAEAARLSRDLVTIRRDVPVALEFDTLHVREIDIEAVRRLYTDLEFHTLLPKLDSGPPPEAMTAAAYGLLTRAGDLPAIVEAARQAEAVALRVETDGANPRRAPLVGLTLATRPGQAWYLPLGHRPPEGELAPEWEVVNVPGLDAPEMAPLADLLRDPAVPKVGHGVKRDQLALRRAGVELAGVVFDTELASFLLDPGRRTHELDVLAPEHLRMTLMPLEALRGKGRSVRPLAEASPARAMEFSAARGDAILGLLAYFRQQLDAFGLTRLLQEVELPLTRVLADMEWRGIAIDPDWFRRLSREFGAELQQIEQAIYREAGTDLNINSTPQLRHVLFEKLNLPVVKKTKTGPSTDAEVLAQLAGLGFEVPRLLLEYRELSKLRSTYVDVLPSSVDPHTGRIHTTFHQTGAQTGRLSSSDPNLQNIPVRTRRGERIRRGFVPGPGNLFVIADYSQIELRVLAHLSDDEAFIGAFGRGGDIHRETAAIIFGVPVDEVTPDMRARAKTINFATIYGQGPFALSRQLGITQEDARDFIRLYFERFAGVRRFLDATVEQAKRMGYVETIFGRRRYIPELKDRSHSIRAFGERTAMNSPMQGSAADIIKVAMIRLHAELLTAGLSGGVLLQVHDELVVEAPESEVEQTVAMARAAMEGAASLRVPLVVDIGTGSSWLEAKR
jgi:DNA polymerase-1